MRAKAKKIGGVLLGSGGGMLILASENSAQDVASNLASWLKLFGVQHVPAAVFGVPLDTAGLFGGIAIILIAAAWALWPEHKAIRGYPSQPRPLSDPPLATLEQAQPKPSVHIEVKHYIHGPVMPADGRAFTLATCRPGDAAPDMLTRMSQPGSLVFGPMEHMHYVSLLVTNDGDAALIDLDVPFRSRFLKNHAAMTGPFEEGLMRFPRLDPGSAARLEVLLENRDSAMRVLYIVIDDEGEATHSKSSQRLKIKLHHPGPHRITALPLPPFSPPAEAPSPPSPKGTAPRRRR